jgi:hypothetical protein
MKKKLLRTSLIGFVSLMVMAGCSMVPGIPGTGGLVSATAVPSPTSTLIVSTLTADATQSGPVVSPATVEPSGSGTAVALPTQSATMVGSPTGAATATPGEVAGQNLSITLADDGKTFTFKAGQRFLLNLGADYEWSPVVADQGIVSRVPNIAVIRGAQGIYEAHVAGRTTLTADGEPACRQAKPACAMPSRLFKVTLVVEP